MGGQGRGAWGGRGSPRRREPFCAQCSGPRKAVGFGKPSLLRCLTFPQTLVLIGCFTVFWTIYYMLEVYLSQRNVASHPVCKSGPCHWPQQSRKAKEEGTELEAVPLCSSQDPGGVGTESEGPSAPSRLRAPDLLDQGDWSLSQNRGALDCPQRLPPDLLQGKGEQIC